MHIWQLWLMVICQWIWFLGVLTPKPTSQSALGDSVQYLYAPELHGLLHTSDTSQHSGTSSLVDSGCFKSPTNDEFSSLCIMDDFDTLIRQLKSIGNMDLKGIGNTDIAISSARSPVTYLQDEHTTVPYFPPVTSALRREQRMFSYGPQSSCLEYTDDHGDELASPQQLLRDHAISSDELNFTSSATDLLQDALQPAAPSESLLMQFCSQSCPDVYSPAANVHHRTSPSHDRFDG